MNIKNKLSSLMYAPLALALLAACSSDDVVENNQPTTQGQTLTINATTGSEDGTRVDFGNDGNGKYATSWQSTDQVKIYAGNINNVGTFNVDGEFTNHNAKLTGVLTTKLTEKTTLTGYIVNGKVKTSNNGVIDENGFGKQIEVDYSEQNGTWEDAVSRCVLFGKGEYDPANAEQPVNMNFEYKTTFFKLILDFGETTATSANLCLTGDNIVSKSRIHALNNATNGTDNTGATNYVDDWFINIKNTKIDNNKATVYVALYSRQLKNVYLQAELDNGDIYDFNISNGKTSTPAAGKVYTITRVGEKQIMPENWNGEGSEKSPYLIQNLTDLKLLAQNVKNGTSNYNGKFFELTSDLIINGEWEPIGNYGKAFRGIFDGKGHTISGNIKITNVAKNYTAGLFGYIAENAVVKNLISKLNVNATSNNGSTYTGSIIGRAQKKCAITNCVALGNVNADTQFVGGLIGGISLAGSTENLYVTVEACRVMGNVTNFYSAAKPSNIAVGGIIGNIDGNGGDAVNCKSSALVKGCYVIGAKLTSPTSRMTGGIVGMMMNTVNEAQSEIAACWVSNLTFVGEKGYKAAIASSPNDAKIIYKVNTCWIDGTGSKKYVSPNIADGGSQKANPQVNGCENSKALADFVPTMNTAWGSDTYEFNSKGEIVKKVK